MSRLQLEVEGFGLIKVDDDGQIMLNGGVITEEALEDLLVALQTAHSYAQNMKLAKIGRD